jgi:chromate transporter
MLKLGVLAFGGPSAHIAMLEDEVVERRGWMSRQHFLDLVGATSLIPGPNSTQMTMHVGFERAGWPGLMVAGFSFVLPAALITLVLAVLYAEFGTVPAIESFLWGIKPAVLIIILAATWRLGRSALKSWGEGLVGVAVLVTVALGVNEILAFFACALIGAVFLILIRQQTSEVGLALLPALGVSTSKGVETIVEALPPTVLSLGLFFLKVGAILYGSGYVLVAFLEGDLVGRYGWLTHQQLLDAIAIGQMTPGPVLTTATFVGYLLLGVPGAVIATTAIFAPSLILVGMLNPVIEKLRARRWASSFLDSVNSAAVALMVVVVFKLAVASLTGWQAWLIAISCAIALFRFRVHSAWLIIGAAVFGYLLHLVSPGV